MSIRDNNMTAARFATLLDAYGADPNRWPAAERAAGLAYLKGSEEARAAMEPAAALDSLLNVIAPSTQISEDLVDRIHALAPAATPAAVPADRRPGNVIPFWRRATMPNGGAGWQKIAATAILGIAAGVLFSEIRNGGAPSPVAVTAITSPAANTGGLPVIETAAVQNLSLQSDLAALSFAGIDAPIQRSTESDSLGSDDADGSLSDLPLL